MPPQVASVVNLNFPDAFSGLAPWSQSVLWLLWGQCYASGSPRTYLTGLHWWSWHRLLRPIQYLKESSRTSRKQLSPLWAQCIQRLCFVILVPRGPPSCSGSHSGVTLVPSVFIVDSSKHQDCTYSSYTQGHPSRVAAPTHLRRALPLQTAHFLMYQRGTLRVSHMFWILPHPVDLYVLRLWSVD